MSGVKRVYVEKKPEYAVQAKDLLHEVESYSRNQNNYKCSCTESL